MDRVNYDDLQLDDDGVFHWNGEPFNGTAFELYPDGQLHREVEMCEGVAEGYWCKWFRYDQRKVEGFIGLYSWTRDRALVDSGSSAGERFSIHETIWDDTGKIVSKDARSVLAIPETRLHADNLTKDAKGLDCWQGTPLTGIAFDIHPNGQLAVERELSGGQVNGVVRTWYPSGARQSDGYVSLSGSYIWAREWFPDGMLKREATARDGMLVHETIRNEAGEVVSAVERPALGHP